MSLENMLFARDVGMFGIELEFFLLNDKSRPALDSGYSILEAWTRSGYAGLLCHELASFQLEINPGPWPLSRTGLVTAVKELQRMTQDLRKLAKAHRLRLDSSAFVPNISTDELESPCFFTREPSYLASARYFEHRSACLEWENGEALQLHGDKVVGCINEIHIHVQHRTDRETLEFFNFLNKAGSQTCSRFEGPITVNGSRLKRGCTTTRLFEDANGEWNRDSSVRRVGFLPFAVHSFEEYAAILDTFELVAEPSLLDPFRAVYFWVRLRGAPGRLRVEFRPMEMAESWQERVCYLVNIALAFQQSRAGDGMTESES